MSNDTTNPRAPEYAFASPSLPCNPRPFLTRMLELVSEHGNPVMQEDAFRACLWVVLAQTYGQLTTVDPHAEWVRLYDALPESVRQYHNHN